MNQRMVFGDKNNRNIPRAITMQPTPIRDAGNKSYAGLPKTTAKWAALMSTLSLYLLSKILLPYR